MIAILGLKTDEIQNLINNRENKKGICVQMTMLMDG